MIKRGLLLTVYMFCCLFIMSAQEKAEQPKMSDLFLKMPLSLTPLLSDVDKADFVDFKASDMKASLTNKLGGTSEMVTLSNDYSLIQMTSKSSLQIKLLPYLDGYIIAAVNTVDGPAADSQIKFYNLDWSPLLEDKLCPTFRYTDFIRINDVEKSKEAVSALAGLQLLVYSLKFSPDTTTLHVDFSSRSLLEKKALKTLSPFLYPSFDLKWSADGFLR